MSTNNNLFDLQLLWEATNNGLTFFQDEFPHVGAKRNSLKGFSVRADDDTGSCHVSKSKSTGLYLFNDFGTSDKAVNAVDYVMKRDNVDFFQACKTLFSQFNLPLPEHKKINPTTFSSDTDGKDLGYWHVEFFNEIQNKNEFKRIFPFATQEVATEYDFKEIKYYEKVGQKENGELYLMKTVSSPEFPIFGYDKKDFVKIYQPRAPKGDKYLLKHGFIGTKPERIIYGWDNAFDKVDFPLIENTLIAISDAKKHDDKKLVKYHLEELNKLKLDYVLIATGGSDGINLASLGYPVIWFNSESEVINSNEYYELSKIAKQIVYVPDLDDTGVRQAVYVGVKNIELKLLWLPETLISENKKDLSDWIRNLKGEDIEKVVSVFKKMLSQALNFKFWSYNDKGTLQLNEKKMLHFLKHHNIRIYKTPYKSQDSGKEDDGYFINIENNIIKQVFPSDIRNIVLHWLDHNFHAIDIWNKVLRSSFFTQNQLKALPFFEYKKNGTGKDFQYYFFNNTAVKVTSETIEEIAYSRKLQVSCWEEDVIKRNFKKQEPFFTVATDDLNRKRITILNKNSNYFKVLVNTSRIFWKKDADATQNDLNPFGINSDKLTEEENILQELHLLNKMYCIGYMLHQYKRQSRAFMVLGVDFVSGESVKGSYGGTAKSFLQKAVFTLIAGKNIGAKRLKEDGFPMDGVTPKTKYVLFDDLPAYQDMEFFYNMVTDDFTANQKGGVKYNIPFDDSPKIGATTNFAPDMNISSTKRRTLVYHNSDYYHEATEENGFLFTRKISDDFNGKDLFDKEYKDEDYNNDYNFMLQCLQFYLSQSDKIEAPIGNLVSKNNLMKIGDSYNKFFKELFKDEMYLNNWVEKSKVVAMAKDELGNKFLSAQRFNDNLQLYVSAYRDLGWSIEMKKRKNENNNAVPFFYISTTGEVRNQETEETQPIATEENKQIDIFEAAKKIPDTDLDF